MSYDFAVWDGPPPLSNVHGVSEFERRRAACAAPATERRPTRRITDLVGRLMAIHPEPPNGPGGDCPWADVPLIANAVGSMITIRVVDHRAAPIRKLIHTEADRLGLVTFDPQAGELVPSAVTVCRSAEFELPPPDELTLHLHAVIAEALDASRPMVGVMEERATGYYVQWLVAQGQIVLEAQGDAVLPEGLRTPAAGNTILQAYGFSPAVPNWRCQMAAALPTLERAASALTKVITDGRRIPVGAKMRLETFPAP